MNKLKMVDSTDHYCEKYADVVENELELIQDYSLKCGKLC